MTTVTVKTVCCLVYVIIWTVNVASSLKLPKGFVQCKLSDPELPECLKNGLQSAFPHLSVGVPNLGLLPTDPLHILRLEVNQGTGPIRLRLKFIDLLIHNMATGRVKHLNYYPSNYTFITDFDLQKPIVLDGFYEANGNILVLPITGNGKCKIILDNFKSVSITRMEPYMKNGNTYLRIKDFKFKFTTSRLHLKLDNLFNGDKALGNNMNVFINENWQELLNEMQPAFEEALSAAFVNIGQQFFKRVPFNQIFKE